MNPYALTYSRLPGDWVSAGEIYSFDGGEWYVRRGFISGHPTLLLRCFPPDKDRQSGVPAMFVIITGAGWVHVLSWAKLGRMYARHMGPLMFEQQLDVEEYWGTSWPEVQHRHACDAYLLSMLDTEEEPF